MLASRPQYLTLIISVVNCDYVGIPAILGRQTLNPRG